MKEKILNKIKITLDNPIQGRNSMGASENFYNAYYMVGKCFTEGDLKEMDLQSLENLIRLAEFAGEVFY